MGHVNYFSSPFPAAFILGFTKACDCPVSGTLSHLMGVCMRPGNVMGNAVE